MNQGKPKSLTFWNPIFEILWYLSSKKRLYIFCVDITSQRSQQDGKRSSSWPSLHLNLIGVFFLSKTWNKLWNIFSYTALIPYWFGPIIDVLLHSPFLTLWMISSSSWYISHKIRNLRFFGAIWSVQTLWHLWLEHNNKTFQNFKKSPSQIWEDIVNISALFDVLNLLFFIIMMHILYISFNWKVSSNLLLIYSTFCC